ncbi:hypothetical protein SS50377_21259 [Spironucleus salmonicida]|uniref:Uncharacterized protein n=1 Tax=Spironucleus salmonicida TaxID=348837 RepID=V6LHI3_9EUKA|nr:hypothetical protein SS50377_21259 [Spironucleus salmonicida]|eukprot:EST44030.1 hypothetical protein SS50377_16339 [Spironucleus salmonicida]
MFIQVSKQQESLQVTTFRTQEDFKPIHIEKLDFVPVNIFKTSNKILAICANEIKLLDSSFKVLSTIQNKLKHSKLTFKNDYFAIYQNEKIDVYSTINEIQLVHTHQTSFPTHLAIFNNLLALYFKVRKNQYQLQIVDYVNDKRQVFNFRERCKTLQFDFNQEIILITKSNTNKYTFQRFQFFENKDTETVQEELKFDDLREDSDDEHEEIESPEVHGDDVIYLTGVARTLSYQFRTCFPDQNIVIAGRFDSYIIMENKKNPLSCIMHCSCKLNKYYEKLIYDYSQQGNIVVYASPDQQTLHFVRQFELVKSMSIKSNQVLKSIFNKTLKIDDILILPDSTLVVQTQNYLVNYGMIAEVVQQKELEMQRFCFHKTRKSALFIYKDVIQIIQISIINEEEKQEWFMGRIQENLQTLETYEIAQEEHVNYVLFNTRAQIDQYTISNRNRLIIQWTENDENFQSAIDIQQIE